jgi:hypothetical protein
MQPARAQRIASHPVQHSAPPHASHPVQRSAPRECNQPAAHCIANNPRTVQRATRTDNQPAAHRPPRTTHTSHLQRCAHASQYFVLVSFGSWKKLY